MDLTPVSRYRKPLVVTVRRLAKPRYGSVDL